MARVTNWLRDQVSKRMNGWRDASAATLTLPSAPQGKDTLGLTIHREDGLYRLVDLERDEAHVFYACLGRYLSEVFAVAPGALLP